MNIREWLTQNKDNYDGGRAEAIKECAEELSVTVKAVQNMASRVWPIWEKNKNGMLSLSKVSVGDKKTDIMQPEEFINGIDIVRQIVDFLNKEVKDGYIEDEKLRRRFEIGMTKWNEIKKLPVWEGRVFVYNTPTGSKTAVWSSRKGIELARETISMARYEL